MKAKPIASPIRRFLHSKNRKSTDLAKEMGVSNSTISLWISKKRVPSAQKLVKLAKLTGIPVEDLI